MIITVTMNPAIDKTISIPSFVHGGLNRITHIERDAGGKGINVSKTIKQLGGKSLAVGFLAGNAGDTIEQVLKMLGIEIDFIRVEGETRTNTKVAEPDGTITELNEPGPIITKEHINALICKLESYAAPDTLIVLAGSVPSGTDRTIYRTIIEKVHAKGGSVLLDADGDLFAHAISAGPDLVKPNLFELEQFFQTESMTHDADSSVQQVKQTLTDSPDQQIKQALTDSSDQQVKQTLTDSPDPENISGRAKYISALGQKLLSYGVQTAAISMGPQGAFFLNIHEQLYCPALSVNVQSTVGAGDAMVAALALGWENKMNLTDCALLGMAVSAGAVTTAGTKPPSLELINELKKNVLVQTI